MQPCEHEDLKHNHQAVYNAICEEATHPPMTLRSSSYRRKVRGHVRNDLRAFKTVVVGRRGIVDSTPSPSGLTVGPLVQTPICHIPLHLPLCNAQQHHQPTHQGHLAVNHSLLMGRHAEKYVRRGAEIVSLNSDSHLICFAFKLKICKNTHI
ncbi:hypothetical protein BKA81DRAFT_80263 [Phyllosticta paracitricarpa]